MALVVEDGTVVSGANSYVTDADFVAWAADRALTVTGDTEAALLLAMDYLETLPFIGMRHSRDQSLQWPRDEVWIDNFSYPRTQIPDELKQLQYIVAVAVAEGDDPLARVDRATQSEQLGDLKITYQEKASPVPYSRKITAAERKLIGGGMGSLKRW